MPRGEPRGVGYEVVNERIPSHTHWGHCHEGQVAVQRPRCARGGWSQACCDGVDEAQTPCAGQGKTRHGLGEPRQGPAQETVETHVDCICGAYLDLWGCGDGVQPV
eukprot:5397456-Alexandrium_andersonii.AAC.1